MDDNFDRQRIDWIDFAKGITILLVIIGHNVSGPLRGAIFSFHMPLFFILSCVTYSWSKNSEQWIYKTENAFKHLIIPAMFLSIISVMKFGILENTSNYLASAKLFAKQVILMGTFASGVDVDVLGEVIPAIGLQWFLVVLFCGRSLFDYCNMKAKNNQLLYLSIIVSILGVLIGKIQKLPLSFDIALAIFFFFWMGKNFDKFQIEKNTYKKLLLSLSIWLALLAVTYFCSHRYLELATREYTLFPLCYIIAIAGTVMISTLSVLFSRLKLLAKPVLYLGRSSLWLLCIHKIDNLWNRWFNCSNQYIRALLAVVTDLLVLILIKYIVSRWKENKK